MPMWVTIVVTLLEALANLAQKVVPLIQQGKDTVSLTDAQAIHDNLVKVEDATSSVRSATDAMLAKASGQQ